MSDANNPQDPTRVQILNEAARLIVGQRQQDYGSPEVNFQRIADLINIIIAENLRTNTPLSPRQCADIMILLKVARTVNSPTRDSYVDIGGYAGIAGELAEAERQKQADTEKESITGKSLIIDGEITLEQMNDATAISAKTIAQRAAESRNA